MKNCNPLKNQLCKQRNFTNISLRVLIARAIMLAIQPLHAAPFTWINLASDNASGSWTNSKSWNPNAVPGAADTTDVPWSPDTSPVRTFAKVS
jgi:hypothetical protein